MIVLGKALLRAGFVLIQWHCFRPLDRKTSSSLTQDTEVPGHPLGMTALRQKALKRPPVSLSPGLQKNHISRAGPGLFTYDRSSGWDAAEGSSTPEDLYFRPVFL